MALEILSYSVKMTCMSRKDKKKDKKKGSDDGAGNFLQEETVRAIIAVMFFVVGILFVLASGPIDKAGFVGSGAYNIFHYLFGFGYYLLPILFFILSVSFFRSLHKKLAVPHSI